MYQALCIYVRNAYFWSKNAFPCVWHSIVCQIQWPILQELLITFQDWYFKLALSSEAARTKIDNWAVLRRIILKIVTMVINSNSVQCDLIIDQLVLLHC